MARLKCTVCHGFVDKIRESRNFSAAFIDGSENLRTSSFKDHAKTDMHERAMVLLKKKNNLKTFVTILLLPGHFIAWTLKLRQRSKRSLTWPT